MVEETNVLTYASSSTAAMASRWAALARRRIAVPRRDFGVRWMSQSRLDEVLPRRTSIDQGALPATPETYLALRTSQRELRALPESSYAALIHGAGRTGLAGLVSNIVSDVLEYRAAPPHSERQRRLLLTLLYMCSESAMRLPMAPELAVRLTAALLREHGASINMIPPFVAAHVVKMALSIPSKHGEQHALLRPLFERLTHAAVYPNLEEGLHLVEYMMQYGDADPSVVMELVSRTAQVDVGRLSEPILQQARADGFAWSRWARSAGGMTDAGPLRHAVPDRLKAHAMRISIWSLCCRVWLRMHRARRFRSALEQLAAALARADRDVHEHVQASPSAGIVRALLQTHLVHLAGSASRNGVRAALASLRAFQDTAGHVLPRVIASVCNKALELDMAKEAALVVHTVLDADTHASDESASKLAHALGPRIVLAALAYDAGAARFHEAGRLAQWMHRSLPGDACDLFWPQPLRANVLACLATAEQSSTAASLYTRWAEPRDERRQMAWPHNGDGHDGHHTDVHGRRALAQHALSILGQDCAPPPSEPGTLYELALTAPCMLALVKLFGSAPRHGMARNHPLAVAVRDHFLHAAPLATRPHAELTALAQASLLVGDRSTALALLRLVELRVDDADLAVMLRGACDVDADAAVACFLDAPESAPRSNAQLYAVLFSRCVSLQRFDLAARVQAAAAERGLGGTLARDAHAALLAHSSAHPAEAVRRVLGMLREGWTPDARLVHWVIRCAVRGLSLQAAGSAPGRHASRPALRAALRLFLACARRGYVDLPTVRFLLYHIAQHARERRERLRTGVWTTQLDRVVGALRWAPHLVRASEYASIAHTPLPSGVRQNGAPNELPAPLLRQVVLAYDALRDAHGVAETLAWMHENGTLAERVSSHTPADRAFAAIAARTPLQPSPPRTKAWWGHS